MARKPSDEQRGVRRVLLEILAVVVCSVLVFLFLISLVYHGPEPVRRSSCVNNLKEFGIALQNYHDFNRRFPPAFIADANGIPMHSWRVLLLPYFEDADLENLARQYDFDEPWDGPNNHKLADKMPAIFRCPSDLDNHSQANYVAVVGGETGWPGTNSLSIREIGDGASNTIAIVEIVNSGINWLEPRDLTLGQALCGINPTDGAPRVSSGHPGGANFLFFDGSVHFLENDISPELLRALLTANGHEDVKLPYD